MREAEPSLSSKSSISNSNSNRACQVPVSDKKENRPSKRMQSSHSHIKENTLRTSQQSLRSDAKDRGSTSNGFGFSSNVEEFKVKSTFNSPFLKTNTSGFGATTNTKKVVEKKETMRTWN